MWPRHYAAQIAELKTLQERREALEKVPEHFKTSLKLISASNGRGMQLQRGHGGMATTTLEQLRKRYTRNHVELSEFRADYMPHINNEDHLLRILRTHPQQLRVCKLHASQRAPHIIYLYDLAHWLDAQEAAARAA